MERFIGESNQLDSSYTLEKRRLIAAYFPDRFSPSEMQDPEAYPDSQVNELYHFLETSSRAFLRQRENGDNDITESFVNHVDSNKQESYRRKIDALFKSAEELIKEHKRKIKN